MAAFFQDHRDTLMKAVETAHARVYWTPYGFALGVSYPAAAPDGLVAAAKAAGKSWAAASVEDRVGVALKTLARINKQSFLMANAVMHTSGQAFMMAF